MARQRAAAGIYTPVENVTQSAGTFHKRVDIRIKHCKQITGHQKCRVIDLIDFLLFFKFSFYRKAASFLKWREMTVTTK